ncbi:hypothetical protein ACOMHN_036013 [Nucella lapillus]
MCFNALKTDVLQTLVSEGTGWRVASRRRSENPFPWSWPGRLPHWEPAEPAISRGVSFKSGDMPASCRNCGKTFTYSQNMLRHRRKCEGTFHLECALCGQLFNRKDYYNTHCSTKHGMMTGGRGSVVPPFSEADFSVPASLDAVTPSNPDEGDALVLNENGEATGEIGHANPP